MTAATENIIGLAISFCPCSTWERKAGVGGQSCEGTTLVFCCIIRSQF